MMSVNDDVIIDDEYCDSLGCRYTGPHSLEGYMAQVRS